MELLILEVAGFVGLIILVLFIFAEAAKKAPLGIIASVLMGILGLSIIISGLQYNAGSTITMNQTENTNVIDENTSIKTISGTNTINQTYSNIPSPSSIPMDWILGLILVLLAVYGGLYYSMYQR